MHQFRLSKCQPSNFPTRKKLRLRLEERILEQYSHLPYHCLSLNRLVEVPES